MPNLAYTQLRRNGFGGPPPRFPFGNIIDIFMFRDQQLTTSSSPSSTIHHNIHPTVFPHFSRWRKTHGKVFVYWLGTEPFLYVSDPKFLKEMSARVLARRWGRPSLFKINRKPMFGNGLTMVEGDDWVHHRHAIAHSFSTSNLLSLVSLIVESTTRMLDNWSSLVSSGNPEIEAEEELLSFTGEVIGKASVGISFENKTKIFERIRALQFVLFSSSRFVGVPWGKFIDNKRTMEAKRLGKDIDSDVLLAIQAQKDSTSSTSQNIIGSLLAQQDEGKKKLSVHELVDECKTMMFGGIDTMASTIAWSLLLLAVYPEWQNKIRDDVKEVVKDKDIDATMLSKLKKIGWTMSEVLRLYPSAPNTQMQTREDIRVHDRVIPKGTNIWIDTTAMHHDPDIWGDDVNGFRPDRFKDDSYGGAKHKMGFMPFGFGGRMCLGKELATMEYNICLSLILSRFTIKLKPNYGHSPTTLLTLKTSHGLPLIIQPL